MQRINFINWLLLFSPFTLVLPLNMDMSMSGMQLSFLLSASFHLFRSHFGVYRSGRIKWIQMLCMEKIKQSHLFQFNAFENFSTYSTPNGTLDANKFFGRSDLFEFPVIRGCLPSERLTFMFMWCHRGYNNDNDSNSNEKNQIVWN